ncbi:MAG: hypothetical protein RLZZ337_72 [Bacteroidota bacterium]|jgi:hypothetical protein
MQASFCTIITQNYIGFARATEESLKACDNKPLSIFISEWKKNLEDKFLEKNKTDCYYLDDLCAEGKVGYLLYQKYYHRHISEFRWAMKGVFISFLLNKFEKVIYCDGDMYFYNSTAFLWDLLDTHSVILTPHWRNIDVNAKSQSEITNFESLHTSGLYNAGFLGANRNGSAALQWLHDANLYRCEIKPHEGHFGDQTYFNMLPIYFENVHIIKHQGCNIASWNFATCARLMEGEDVRINGKHPIIFIHFTTSTIFDILSKKDLHLSQFLKEYLEALKRHGVSRNFEEEYKIYLSRPKNRIKRFIKPILLNLFPKWSKLH